MSEAAIADPVAENVPAAAETSQIADFYAGQSILLTGATGFLGKVCLAVHDEIVAMSRVVPLDDRPVRTRDRSAMILSVE